LNVLLTGATGFIGRHIAEALLRRGDALRCLVRRPERAASLRTLGAEIIPRDLASPEAVREGAHGVDAVVHAAALVGEWGSRGAFETANAVATRHVLDAVEAAGIPRLVHLSSTAVYGRRQGLGITEDAPLHLNGNAYSDTKIAAEQLIWERHHAGRVRAACVRPCIVYGPFDWKFIPKIARALEAGRMVLIDGGQHRAPIVNVHDVVRLALACLDQEAALGHAFNCASPEPVSWRHLFEEVAAHVGARAPQRSIPFGVAYAAGSVMEMAWRLAGSRRPPPLTRFGVMLLGVRVVYDTQKAAQMLGFHPQVKLTDGLAETLEWLQAARRDRGRG
jgi:nucleoside-diphosphate-sugar epimerase